MKKITLLFTILCAGQLYSMEPELGQHQGFGGLSPEIQVMIISLLNEYENLDDVIKAIKATSIVDKELNAIINDMYGNQKEFTKLVHMLANKSNESTAQIADKFNTPAAKEYSNLNNQLMVAINSSNAEKITALLDEGADVNYRSNLYTPLTLAVSKWNYEIIKLLLEHRANPNFNNPMTGTALDFAKERHAAMDQKPMFDSAEHRKKRQEIIILLQEAMKKNPFYHTLLNTYQFSPQKSVFIDDQEDNIEAARALGFNGIIYKNQRTTDNELTKLGIE